MENLPGAAELSAEMSLGQPSISRPQSAPPDLSASSQMSDWEDPSVEGDFVVNGRWNVSEDDILKAIATHFLSESFRSDDQRTDSTTESISEYEYESAFEDKDYVRIRGQRTSQWAEKDPMGTYWSKKAYLVIEVRMGHQPLKPRVDTGENGSDQEGANNYEDEEHDPSQPRRTPAKAIGDRKENATAGPSRDIRPSLTPEMKQELDARVWYYRLDMSDDGNEHPFAQAMWWAEDQLIYDAEAWSDLEHEEVGLWEMDDEEMEDAPAVEDETQQQSELATADLPLHQRESARN